MELNKLTDTRYGKIPYNKHDSIIGRDLERYGEWYQAECDLLKKYIQPGWHCLDIGANIAVRTHSSLPMK